MIYSWRVVLSVLILLLSACNAEDAAEVVTLTYESSQEDFTNPERGFYAASHFDTGKPPNPLNAAALISWRKNEGYTLSLIHRSYFLPDYRFEPHLPASFLTLVQNDLASARAAGVKLILRFAYRPNANYENEPVYHDPGRAIILQHLEDLKPVLQANAGVIAYVDAGLIGPWGEWHSATPNNSDNNPDNDPDGPLMNERYGYTDPTNNTPQGNPQHPEYNLLNWNRNDPNAITREIIQKQLEVIPASRPIAIRYPQSKVALLEGRMQADLTEALTNETAYKNTMRARLSAHNDCFLATADDTGTYYYSGIPGLESPEDIAAQIEHEKNYLNQDNLHVPMGGETCADTPYTHPDYDNFSDYAQAELARMRWTTLNADYNKNTLKALGPTLETVKKRLGYRFTLHSSTLPATTPPDSTITLTLTLSNTGYSSPFNPRGLEVVFKSADGTLISRVINVNYEDNTDPRYWQPAETQIIHLLVQAPSEAGEYGVLINLPDPLLPNVVTYTYDGVTTHANYAIRFANETMWQETIGMNQLGHTLLVRND